MTQIEAHETLLMLSFSVCVGARHLGVLALDTLLPLAGWLGAYNGVPRLGRSASWRHGWEDPLCDVTSLPGQLFPLPTLYRPKPN